MKNNVEVPLSFEAREALREVSRFHNIRPEFIVAAIVESTLDTMQDDADAERWFVEVAREIRATGKALHCWNSLYGDDAEREIDDDERQGDEAEDERDEAEELEVDFSGFEYGAFNGHAPVHERCLLHGEGDGMIL